LAWHLGVHIVSGGVLTQSAGKIVGFHGKQTPSDQIRQNEFAWKLPATDNRSALLFDLFNPNARYQAQNL